MTFLRSFVLWILGIGFFMACFPVLAVSLLVLPREKTFRLARKLFYVLIRIMGIDLKVSGRAVIDPDQTYLIMGNHQSLFDLLVIPAAIPLVFTGVEAAYHFSIPVWGYLIRKWGCIPIQRDNLDQAKKSLDQARQTLATGLSIVVLPEGHRTRTGEMISFKKGPFHLAKNTRAPILPFGISGLYGFQQRGGFFLKPGKVMVRIGTPISYASYAHLSVEGLRDLVYKEIRHLTLDS